MALLPRTAPGLRAVATLLALFSGVAAPLAAQGTGTGSAVRVGVGFGGISTVGLTVEYVHEHSALELTLGTWSFRDLSVSVVGKQYLGAGDLLPFVGGGLWLVAARPPGERTGVAAVLQAPVGVDWQAADGSYVGVTLNVNRALAVRRTDPQDELPLNRRLVPLPGVYYRWKRP
ncbi:MAG TPA: hypothetical protein VLH75_00880 [Longimicrobiales bacterium]|nr:hypothetical protein [Longimicrobiales bacterium]